MLLQVQPVGHSALLPTVQLLVHTGVASWVKLWQYAPAHSAVHGLSSPMVHDVVVAGTVHAAASVPPGASMATESPSSPLQAAAARVRVKRSDVRLGMAMVSCIPVWARLGVTASSHVETRRFVRTSKPP